MRNTRDSEFPNRTGPIAVIDGECALCNRVAQAIDRWDRTGDIRIATSQGSTGSAMMRKYGLDPSDPLSWLFVDDGVAYKEMDAVIRLARRIGGVARIVTVLALLPRPVRSWLYRLVARNRYRIFGRADICATPSPSLRSRLVDL